MLVSVLPSPQFFFPNNTDVFFFRTAPGPVPAPSPYFFRPHNFRRTHPLNSHPPPPPPPLACLISFETDRMLQSGVDIPPISVRLSPRFPFFLSDVFSSFWGLPLPLFRPSHPCPRLLFSYYGKLGPGPRTDRPSCPLSTFLSLLVDSFSLPSFLRSFVSPPPPACWRLVFSPRVLALFLRSLSFT